jgi:hypothetical protein
MIKHYLPIELKQNEEHKDPAIQLNVKRWRMECFFKIGIKKQKRKIKNLVTSNYFL